jgi:hypothetical protein
MRSNIFVAVNITYSFQGGQAMKQYKIEMFTQKDGIITAKFDHKKIENVLNSYASEGWDINTVFSIFVPTISGPRQRQFVVMERQK